jgi:hypothetical protein
MMANLDYYLPSNIVLSLLLNQRRQIVDEVERQLSVVREVESAAEVGLVRAANEVRLRSAFEGEVEYLVLEISLIV